MKKVYDKTKNKIKSLWGAVDELNGKITKLTEQITALQGKSDNVFQELNRPKVPININPIDIKKSFLVSRDASGNVELDVNGLEKISPLYNIDATKTSVVWDPDGQCFRFYAVYAPGI